LFVGLLTLLMTASAVPAYAHGGDFVTVVTSVSPAFPGVSAVSTADGEHFTLTSTGPGTLLVTGYFKEPYLRIDASGVWKNRRSPTAYDDSEDPQTAPADASATAAPQWVHLGPQHDHTWHDHRTHWMSSVMPTQVQSDPDHTHLIRAWTIPITYDGTPGTISGTLTYEAEAHQSLSATWVAIGVVVAGFGVIQFVVRPIRRKRLASAKGA
jgi:hypothetical protein